MPNYDANAFGNNFAAKQTAIKKPKIFKRKKIVRKLFLRELLFWFH